MAPERTTIAAISIPASTIAGEAAEFPDGIVVDLTDSRPSSEAQGAIRPRLTVKRLMRQFRDASP